jgi:formylglycine-generating enzyme required for sulfatase activity
MRKLRVFLCHASDDKPAVRKLFASLKSVPWIDPWLDEENLLPGQDFDLEIYKATRDADAIIICLSKISVAKEGYVNKEIRRALEIADEKPEGAIYVIPLRLDDCIPSFERLKKLQWADYFTPNAHERLLKSLRLRADALKIGVPETTAVVRESSPADDGLDLYRFIKIEPQKNSKVTYPFWIGKYPVTNAQYERFLNAPDFANIIYWLEFPKFDENCTSIGDWGRTGVDWLKEQLKESKSKVLLPRYWDDKNFGKSNPNHPVVGIAWYEASAYCEWLFQNWDALPESKANPIVKPQSIRLPLETEWVTAAGGDDPANRFPWDEAGRATTLLKEILRRANTSESEIGYTTPVNQYPLGKSPFGVMDMAGNVWEWQANYSGNEYAGQKALGLRGGSWSDDGDLARVSVRGYGHPSGRDDDIGFRVVLALPSG